MKKNEKNIVKERKLEDCSEAESDLPVCNMLPREALLSYHSKNGYSQDSGKILTNIS